MNVLLAMVVNQFFLVENYLKYLGDLDVSPLFQSRRHMKEEVARHRTVRAPTGYLKFIPRLPSQINGEKEIMN